MRVIIADDEPVARQVLRELLEDFADIEIVGEAADGPEAVGQLRQRSPDLVFLDLQMPGLDGFAVARSLHGTGLPLVVFVTAFGEHALEAFDIGAVDYLLKPVRRERLAAALEKARAQLDGMRGAAAAPKKDESRPWIIGKLGANHHVFRPDEVVAFQADGEVVYVLTKDGRYYASHSLKALESRLPRPPFQRVHRKTIVNADHIRKLSPLSSKRWLLTMSNGLEVVVSKRLTNQLRESARW